MVRIALALLLCLLLAPAALAEKRVALVIGIDKYDNLGANAQLKKAKSDAAAVTRVLRDLGFDVIAKEDVSRSAFNSHWQDFLNKLAPGDTAVFYFAGHGVEFSGRTYLLPRDVPNLKPGRDELNSQVRNPLRLNQGYTQFTPTAWPPNLAQVNDGHLAETGRRRKR